MQSYRPVGHCTRHGSSRSRRCEKAHWRAFDIGERRLAVLRRSSIKMWLASPYCIGYRSLMAFVRDIPDVVTVKLIQYNHTMLHAVLDRNTQHEDSGVVRQKHSRSGIVPRPRPKRTPETRHAAETTLTRPPERGYYTCSTIRQVSPVGQRRWSGCSIEDAQDAELYLKKLFSFTGLVYGGCLVVALYRSGKVGGDKGCQPFSSTHLSSLAVMVDRPILLGLTCR